MRIEPLTMAAGTQKSLYSGLGMRQVVLAENERHDHPNTDAKDQGQNNAGSRPALFL
jgi:hypothetical protein